MTSFDRINQLARDTPWAHGAVLAYASFGVGLFAALLVAGWWHARGRDARTMAAALWAGAATLLAVALNQPLVAAFHEPRPYSVRTDILVLAQRSGDLSFPSDHAVMAGAAAAGLWLVSRRLGAVAVAAALLMAFARVYIGAHDPRDVLAGLLVGVLVTVTGWWLLHSPLVGAIEGARRGPLRPLLASSHGELSGSARAGRSGRRGAREQPAADRSRPGR